MFQSHSTSSGSKRGHKISILEPTVALQASGLKDNSDKSLLYHLDLTKREARDIRYDLTVLSLTMVFPLIYIACAPYGFCSR
jgi:hypothetical protein